MTAAALSRTEPGARPTGRTAIRSRPVRITLETWVELRGFEPLTPSMRTRCATGLRYSPKNGCQRSKHPGLASRPGSPPLVADGADGGVGVLVVELVADPARDVDDIGLVLGRRGGLAGRFRGA